MSLAAYSSLANEDNTAPAASNPLAVFDTQIIKLTEDVDKLENDTNRMSEEDYHVTNKGYIDLFKQIELDLNRGIVSFDGKTRMGIIRQQKTLAALKKRFEGIMFMKGRFFEDGSIAVPIGDDEKDEEEDFGLVNGSTVQKRNFAKKDCQEERKAQLDRELIKSIMQDMKEITEKQARAAEVHVFNVEEANQKTDKPQRKIKADTGLGHPDKILVIFLGVLFIIFCIVFH